jgi:hypothetical protein
MVGCTVVCAANAIMWCELFLKPASGFHGNRGWSATFIVLHVAGIWCALIGMVVALFADPALKREATWWALPFFAAVGLLNLVGIFWADGQVVGSMM